MNNRCSLIFILSLITTFQAWSIDVGVNTQVFKDSETPYVEIYSRIIGQTATFKFLATDSTTLRSTIEMLVLIKQSDSLLIAEKYNIESPSFKSAKDFWDRRRYRLDAQRYSLEIQYVDLNNPADTLNYYEEIDLGITESDIAHSDILLISDVAKTDEAYNFQRSNFYYEPLCFDLINEATPSMYAYLELYDLKDQIAEDFFIRYFPVDLNIENSREFETGFKKVIPSDFNPILINYDCEKLPSGNYNFVIELCKKDKSTFHRIEKSFSVFHPVLDLQRAFESDKTYETSFVQLLDKDELDYSLKAIFPVLKNNMTETLNYIIASDDVEVKRYFLFQYWSRISEDNPKAVYDKYMKVAKIIDLEFASNVGRGFETDRGYIFLKYGKPNNSIIVEDEPSAPPYEIWIYNYVPETQQTNVKFLFYNPSLVTNDYKLLHSTCRGEISNPRWEVELYSDDFMGQNGSILESNTTQDNFNRNARRYFEDF